MPLSLLEQTDSMDKNRPNPSIQRVRLNVNLTLVFRLCLLCAVCAWGGAYARGLVLNALLV